MENLKRTHSCGALTARAQGQQTLLMGWVSRRRDLGQIIFVDVRDREGITQVVFDAESHPDVQQLAKSLRSEFVIAVQGVVRERAGRADADPETPRFRATGLTVTYDQEPWFVRVSLDPKVNYTDSNMTRVAIGQRF